MIFSGSAVQVKGLGASLVSRKKRLMAAWRSTIERKTPHLKRAPGQLGEEALDGIEPGSRGRGVMEHKAWMPTEPGPRLWVFVGA